MTIEPDPTPIPAEPSIAEIDAILAETRRHYAAHEAEPMERSARQGLELVLALDPDAPRRRQLELEFRYFLGNALLATYRYDEASEALDVPIADDEPVDNPRLPILLLHTLGRVEERRDRHAPALACYDRVVAMARAAGLQRQEVIGHNGRGRIHLQQSRFAEALEAFTEALDLARSVGDPGLEAGVRNNMGLLYSKLGDNAQALEHYLAVRTLFEGTESPMLGGVLINIGSIHIALGNYDTAIEYFNEGLALCETQGRKGFAANALVNIGHAYLSLGNDEAALEWLERGLAAQCEVGHVEHAANAEIHLGELKARLGDPTAARGHFERAAEGLAECGSKHRVATAGRLIGELVLAPVDPTAAIEKIEAALAIAGEAADAPEQIAAHAALSKLYRALGDATRALHHLEEYHRLRELRTTEESREKLHRMQVLHDVESARRNAELHRLRTVELASALEELKAAQTQLVHAEKMASLGQLTAGIAHEINNPVNFIRASTSPLRRDLDEVRAIVAQALEDESAETRERVERRMRELEVDELRSEIDSLLRGIEEGASRTAEIVRGLRSFSRLGEDDLKPADLHEGLDATLTLLRPRLRDGVIVERSYGELSLVECNAGQINQVFMNVLSNAIDAMEGSGRITIATSMRDDHAWIEISDTGEGIDEAVASRIFEPFFTTKAIGAGSGLGLSISYGIIEKHRGTIAVQSVRGEGTTFVIELPVSSPPIPG
ncbi:MAG TPA: tetratricopeptide repeat protein [Candidatus Kapabacteria bacterium]|nr:tetratricopeptide repeat protein [Candidatus Kapabacteria bacterium]